MKKFLLFGALISLMACSQVDTNVTDAPLEGTNITLGLPNTRTSLGEKEGDTYPIYWSEEDKIVVNGAVSSSVIIDKNRKSATFNFANDILSYPYCITYPYTAESSCADGTPTVVFAAEQHFVEGTFGVGAAPMCGYCESGGSPSLKHLAGVLQLSIKGSTTLADIEISAADGVALAGEFGVDCQSGAISAIEGKVANKLTYFVNQTLSTTDATVCHIVVPAGNLGACKVLLTANNGEQMILKWSASDVKAGVVREFKEFVFKPGTMLELEGLPSEEDDLVIIPPTPRPANNEIWYTSSDGAVVTPYATDVFGANIVSNTYENGKGVIKFDGDVTSIGHYAFYKCDSLTSVTIPDSVTSIGYYAFYKCTSLTSITIPDSVTSIGNYTFYYCTSLTSATIGNSVTSIGNNAFDSCTSLTSVTIGNRVTSIEGKAFYECTSLTSVTIPDGVTSIGKHAFYNCSSLTSVTIPDSVTSIGEKAFYYCTGELIINSKIIETDYHSNNCSSSGLYGNKFTAIVIGDNIAKIGSYAFHSCTSLTSITITNKVTSIGDYAFRECTSLTSVTIPDGVTSIGEDAFCECTSLTNVTIPDSVTSIGDNTFYKCTSLKSVTIPNSVTSIGKHAFYNCSSLTSVTIPDSVTSIGKDAFYNCTSLTSVYCKPTTPPTGGSNMFYYNASNRKIYVPYKSIEAYKTTEGWINYADCLVAYDFESSEVVDKPENRTIWYAAMAKFDESSWSYETFGANIVSHEWDASGSNGLITFDKSITTIGAYAFYCGNGNKLLDIVIPDSVTSIGNNAFDGAGFRNVNIPNGVTSIGDYAFSYCGSLQSVTIPENVKTIGKYAFAYGGINEVYCKASTPPTLGVGGIEAWIRIYVPADSEALYKNTWSDYSSYIVGYDF